MTTESDYETFLAVPLRPGFLFRELVSHARDKQVPPRVLWKNIITPLEFGNELRRRMMVKHRAKGLLCVAAFRPTGGAANSMHKKNGALDLDLFPSDYHLASEYATEAVHLFVEMAPRYSLGLGVYGRPKSLATIRVHIDGGKHKEEDRGWQIYGKTELGLSKSDIARIMKRDGLVLP